MISIPPDTDEAAWKDRKASGAGWTVRKEWVASVLIVWILLAVLFPCIFYFGFGADNWRARTADRGNCARCDCMHQRGCWDGRFKGSYPTNGYKSVWFNLDLGTALILGDLVLYLSLTLEAVKALILCWPRMAWAPLASFGLLVYPNFYGFWSIFTYINDRNWQLLDNQLFFCLTEGIAAFLCVYLCDSSRPSAPAIRARGIVCGIAASHVVLALIDQLRGGYFVLAPHFFQQLRDLFLLLPELAVIVLLVRRPALPLMAKCVALIVPLSLLFFWLLPIRWLLTGSTF